MRRQLSSIAVSVAFLVSLAAGASADTIYVNDATGNDKWDGRCEVWDGGTCGPKRTIQAGIDVSVDGDEVQVADGTYRGPGNRALDFEGRAIILRSTGGPEACVIDCEGAARGFNFRTAETRDSIVDGFTVKRGAASLHGGAIRCVQSSPTILNSILMNCTAGQFGGAVYSSDSDVLIRDTIVTGNTAQNGGGGIYAVHGSPRIIDSQITDNSTETRDGGGVVLWDGGGTVSGCLIARNHADEDGGGIHCRLGIPTISSCVVLDNSAGIAGGGLALQDLRSTAVITDLQVVSNVAGAGGGVLLKGGPLRLDRCRIEDNRATQGSGGGVRSTSYVFMTNCALAGNEARTAGGAISGPWEGVILINCTVIGNSSQDGDSIVWSGAGLSVVNSIVRNDGEPQFKVINGTSDVRFSNIRGGWPGEGNIDADPGFAFASDNHLAFDSVSIDSGTNEPPFGLTADLDGNSRPMDGDGDGSAVADMGAYEFNPSRPTIGLSADRVEVDVREGSSTIVERTLAIRNAGGTELIWEIEGDCGWLAVVPRSGSSTGEIDEVMLSMNPIGLPRGYHACTLTVTDPDAVNNPRDVAVVLHVFRDLQVPAEVAFIQDALDQAIDGDIVTLADGIYTGPRNTNLDFLGKRVVLRSQNGPQNCTIDCAGTSRAIHIHSGEGGTTVVEGITIVNGSVSDSGGGILVDDASPTIRDCVFRNNEARDGGGLFVKQKTVFPVRITACIFEFNNATNGGGLLLRESDAWVRECEFRDNRASDWGGAISIVNGVIPSIANCIMLRNEAFHGGAISSNEAAEFNIENTIIRDNVAGQSGGGIHVRRSFAAVIRRCDISANQAGYGGGVYSWNANVSIVASTLAENDAVYSGGGIHCNGGDIVIRDCLVAGNTAQVGAGLEITNLSDSALTNLSIVGNVAVERGGGLYCGDNTEVVADNCIFWQNDASLGPQIALNHAELAVAYSDLQDGRDAVFVNRSELIWGDGNIDADPLFVDRNIGNYRLDFRSPCIDAGDNTAVPPDTVSDLDGGIRLVDDPYTIDTGNGQPPIVDMGAYEFQTGIASPFDIKPGSCPNSFNRTSRGKTPAAIAGTNELDVGLIDVESVQLWRADGVGGTVMPLNGSPGPRIRVEDVATAFEGQPCDCHELEGDGVDDLSMKFDTQSLVAELELSGLPGGAFVELVISGQLLDGTNFSGIDCIRLVPPNGGGQGLTRSEGEAPDGDTQPKPSFSVGAPKENGEDPADESMTPNADPTPIGCGGVMPSFLLATLAGMWLMTRRVRPI